MGNNIVHVYPKKDIAPHVTTGYELGYRCPCCPVEQWVEGGLIVKHHSYDGREVWEEIEDPDE